MRLVHLARARASRIATDSGEAHLSQLCCKLIVRPTLCLVLIGLNLVSVEIVSVIGF